MPGKPRYGQKRDRNEPDIVRVLEAVGCRVRRLEEWDLMVLFRGEIYMLEVKAPMEKSDRKKVAARTQRQEEMLEEGWPLHIVETPNEALRAIGARRR